MRLHFTVFTAASLADRFCSAGRCAAGAVARFRVSGISGAGTGMCAVTVGSPCAIVMSKRIAVLKGFRSLFAADSAGLVIDRFFCAGCSRFQVLFFCLFCREVMRQKITVFRLAVLADRFLCTGGCAAMAVVRFCVVCISRADARMRAVVVGSPRAIVMSKRIAVLKGFRALFAADSAGLVIDRFFCAGCSRFQILFFCCLSREVMRQKITVFRLAVLADCFLCAGSCAAMAVVRFRMVCISRADARMCAVVVGCPRAVIMSERIAILKGFRALFAADGAGLVIDCFCCAGRGRFQILVVCFFGRWVML